MVIIKIELWTNNYKIVILNDTYFLTDSKDIINNSIKNYVLKLFKKRKNTESKTKKIVENPIKDIQNSNEKISENIQVSSTSSISFILF